MGHDRAMCCANLQGATQESVVKAVDSNQQAECQKQHPHVVSDQKKGRIEMFVQTWTWMCNHAHTYKLYIFKFIYTIIHIYSQTCKCAVCLLSFSVTLSFPIMIHFWTPLAGGFMQTLPVRLYVLWVIILWYPPMREGYSHVPTVFSIATLVLVVEYHTQ